MQKFLFILTTGFALFSMFFGAGNLVFPLAMGAQAQEHALTAICGLLFTAVGLPMVGFLAIIKLQGNTRSFFSAFGSKIGLFLQLVIISVLCPLGAMPRCIALTHTIMQEHFSWIGPHLVLFSLFSCILIFFCTVKKQKLVKLLGQFLTPILLLTLGLIIVSGYMYSVPLSIATDQVAQTFVKGLFEGYQMMDLLAALFFSALLFAPIDAFAKKHNEPIFPLALQIVAVAGTLLSLSYLGFGLLAAREHELLKSSLPQLLLVRLSDAFLGQYGAYVTAAIAVLACLTTAIALGACFANFLQKELFQDKITYPTSLGTTLFITYCMATLSFSGIVAFLGPILDVSYPLLIVLCLYHLVRRQRLAAPL